MPLKILLVLSGPNPFPGAAWTRIGFFSKLWSEKGHKIDVLGAFSYKSFQKIGFKKFRGANIYNIIFNANMENPVIFLLNISVSLIISVYFMLVKRPSITVVSVPSGDVGLGALMACKLLNIKCAVDYRDQWEDYVSSLVRDRWKKILFSLIKKLALYLYATADLVSAVTPNFREYLLNCGLKNVKLVPNGADAITFIPKHHRKNSFIILYSGAVGGYYRLDVVIKALKRLVDIKLDIKLVIIGDGEINKILSMASKYCLSSNVEYKGSIADTSELVKTINASDIGLIPYDDNYLWKNSLPAKFFEYCSCGKPIVATAHFDSLIAKLTREYFIGLVSPPLDEEGLAKAIYQIYTDRSFRETAGNNARKMIEEKFDRNKIADEFLKILVNMT